MDFLKRVLGSGDEPPAPPPDAPTDGLQAEDHELKLTYRAKSSQGVRMTAGPNALATLPEMLADVSQGRVTVVPPLDSLIHAAAPDLLRPEEAEAWLHATRDQPPDIRHGLMILASLDALDPAFETSALSQLSGETDTSGYPAYDAIVGGVVSHWDEQTGDMIVRGVVGWGGRGVRGDTDRTAYRLLASLLSNILANKDAVGIATVDRPLPKAGSGGLVCAHCGFASGHERAFYCPKCGMRLLRG